MLGHIDPSKVFNVIAKNGKTNKDLRLSYTTHQVAGTGTFGVVYKAKLKTGELVAIKKVNQDKRYKNRELQIMQALAEHPNIVTLKWYFRSQGGSGVKKDAVFLNLVLEYVPETIHQRSRHYVRIKQRMPDIYIQLYTVQLLRAVAYLHSLGICHRDIKPQNILLDPATNIVKLCDFGSAKILTAGDANVSYICSRYYRAPELILGAEEYTVSIDMWSAGCVIGEMILGTPLFPGENSPRQMAEIVNVLGTPTQDQVRTMNPSSTAFTFPDIPGQPLASIFPSDVSPDLVDLLDCMLRYEPHQRITAAQAVHHSCFHDLRKKCQDLSIDTQFLDLSS
ncbi:kinase-like domain-containing protein [Radiomyces spectabilis]|uniref:kinase-like domain-containing protein n=1 Tax=Radiomyces spectabilis TaxID=64574 RepID=UPI00221F5675|nr:kinase-like domain-containing protein [Radiomyces spectabilis]KAI8374284.1 kinase-like domain-containing protein [Radiomyces spectabilis]